jgi:hypothetical protein
MFIIFFILNNFLSNFFIYIKKKRKIYQKIFINLRYLLFLKRNFFKIFENEYNENKIHCNFSIKYIITDFTICVK